MVKFKNLYLSQISMELVTLNLTDLMSAFVCVSNITLASKNSWSQNFNIKKNCEFQFFFFISWIYFAFKFCLTLEGAISIGNLIYKKTLHIFLQKMHRLRVILEKIKCQIYFVHKNARLCSSTLSIKSSTMYCLMFEIFSVSCSGVEIEYIQNSL